MQLNLKVRPVKRLTKIREVFLVHFQTDGEVIFSELLGEPSKHLLYRALTMFLWSFVLAAFDFRDKRSCHFPSSDFSKATRLRMNKIKTYNHD